MKLHYVMSWEQIMERLLILVNLQEIALIGLEVVVFYLKTSKDNLALKVLPNPATLKLILLD